MTENVADYTVKDLLNQIRETLSTAYPSGVWIRGTISNYGEAPSGHTYFSLCEKVENAGEAPKFSLSVVFFKGARQNIAELLEGENGCKLENDLEVRIYGKIDTYNPRSQIQLKMSAIDVGYTKSKLAANKDRLLTLLREQGLLDINPQLDLNPLPLHIALITSSDSDARHDFVKQLSESGFGWQVSIIHTSVQGSAAPAEILTAIQKAGGLEPDVIAMVRGGGSMSDLAAFDDESVARAVAGAPVPVFCGIGHQTDVSVVDHVVYTSAKTPTACAQALIEHVTNTQKQAQDIFDQAISLATQNIQGQKIQLTQLAAETAHAPSQSLSSANQLLSSYKGRLKTSASHVLKTKLGAVDETRRDLPELTFKKIKRGQMKLSNLKEQIQILDPAKFIKRGWSITHTSEGKLVRTTKDAPAGTTISTQISDGQIRSTVD